MVGRAGGRAGGARRPVRRAGVPLRRPRRRRAAPGSAARCSGSERLWVRAIRRSAGARHWVKERVARRQLAMQNRSKPAPLDKATRKARGRHSPTAARAAAGDDMPRLESTSVLHVLTTAIVNKALPMFQRPTAAQAHGSGRARFRSRRLPWVWVKVLFTLDFENPCAVAPCGADWCYRRGWCGTGNAGAPTAMPEPETEANAGKLISAGGTKVRRDEEPPPEEPTGGWLEGSEALHLLFAEVLELGAGATADAIKTALVPIVQDQNEFVAGTTAADFVAVVKELVDLGEKGAHHGQWQVAWGQGGRPTNGECRNVKSQFAAAGVIDPVDWGRTFRSTNGRFNLGAETQGGGFCLVTHEQVQMTKAMERFMGSQCVNDLDKLRQEERGAEADVGDTKAVLQDLCSRPTAAAGSLLVNRLARAAEWPSGHGLRYRYWYRYSCTCSSQ
eukprot:COSAG04_NODE_84_length_27625_cov_23.289835_8_plen_446_part_00